MKKVVNDKFIELNKDNLRGFTLVTNSEDIKLWYDDHYYIKRIQIEEDFKLNIKDKITVDGQEYIVNLIEDWDDMFHIIEAPITKTTQFILPMLGKSFSYFDINGNLYNSYISKSYSYLYLVYKFSKDSNYLDLEERLENHSGFIEKMDPNSSLVVFKFEIPKKYWEEVKLVMKGKYSKLSTITKNLILSFHNLGINSRTYKTLFRDKKFKELLETELECDLPDDAELMTKPNLKEEIWEYQNILKKVGTVN